MELFAPVRAATLDFERDGAQDAGPLSLVDASPSKAQQHGCTLRSAHMKGLNPQAEQLGRATPGFRELHHKKLRDSRTRLTPATPRPRAAGCPASSARRARVYQKLRTRRPAPARAPSLAIERRPTLLGSRRGRTSRWPRRTPRTRTRRRSPRAPLSKPSFYRRRGPRRAACHSWRRRRPTRHP